jgi:hypothetical protein
MHYPKKIA